MGSRMERNTPRKGIPVVYYTVTDLLRDARIRYNYYAGGAQPAQWASVRHGRADLRPSLRNGAIA